MVMALKLNYFKGVILVYLYIAYMPGTALSTQAAHTPILNSPFRISSVTSMPSYKNLAAEADVEAEVEVESDADITLASSSLSSSSSSTETDDELFTQKENILEKSYHGLIRENETSVEVIPLIKVDEEKICNFHIVRKPYHDIPFQIELVNNLGVITARRTLNCEKHKTYHFEIVAVFCDGTHSASANVHIAVIDVNEYPPTFVQSSYIVEADEGRLYKEIIRVEATDKDCTPLYGDICKYELLNKDQPFIIDNEGSIKNTMPLSHKLSQNHILSVVAYDCAMLQSSPVIINVKVRRVCETRFHGIPERIDYTASSSESLPLLPNAHLELCDAFCEPQSISLNVILKTKHISFGCDRDVSNCSRNVNFVDLLPRGADWTHDLSSDEGSETIFHFDGRSGVDVPNQTLAQYDFSQNAFSIMTIFRHAGTLTGSNNHNNNNNKHIKEHIICTADDHKMNRHHMALFVRNCRLILLVRKNFNEGDLNIFSPAEWRWKLSEVCDNEWHHYVLNVDPNGKVKLYIDGQHFENSIDDHYSNPQIIDDWPLHAAHGVNTTLTIGACYQSSENRFKHGFNGDISEIKISLNGMLSAEDIKCGSNCVEHLLLPNMNKEINEFDTQIKINNQKNNIYIKCGNKSNIEHLLQHIQYINKKKNATIGRRNIELHSTLICTNQSVIHLPSVETYIMVNAVNEQDLKTTLPFANLSNYHMNSILDSQFSHKNKNDFNFILSEKEKKNLPNTIYNMPEQKASIAYNKVSMSSSSTTKIIIEGKCNHLVSYPEIKRGVHILDNINISVLSNESDVEAKIHTLDTCSVLVFPSLNPDHEELQVDGDESLSTTLDIKTNINKDGVEMIGTDKVENYLYVLKALVYSNKKPAYYLNRVFKVTCSRINFKYTTAEFTLTLTVLHPKQQTSNNVATVSNMQTISTSASLTQKPDSLLIKYNDNKVFSRALNQQYEVGEPKSYLRKIEHKVDSIRPTMFIILVCVFLVIVLSGISITHLKNKSNTNHKYNERHQPSLKKINESLAWDDSALTITINPMQDEIISDDTTDSENSDTEEEEVKGRFANVNQLEWDNSNMFTTTMLVK